MLDLETLNPEQKRAAQTTEGPLLVIAGAGAGKTKTITYRVLNLIEKGIPPHEILAITFTNKAAAEMRGRVLRLLGKESTSAGIFGTARRDIPFLSTFHALGVYILRNEAERLGLPKNFTIYDRDEQLATLKQAIRDIGLDPKQWEPAKLLGAISRNKGNLVSPEGLAESSEQKGTGVNVVALAWPRYEALKAKQKALDFDDLLGKVVTLFKKNHDILEKYQEAWKYIHIDEYQDTNTAQYEIARLLASKYKNICVVGDTDQTIYSWRGANFRNILNFEKEYPSAAIVLLEENYRSTKTILDAANHIIKKNRERHEKNLFTKKGDGHPIEIVSAFSEGDEARAVAERTVEMIDKGVNAREIAVLFRANFQSRALEEAFLKHRLPYQLLGTRFYDRKEIRDVLAYLRLAENPDDTESLKRVINVPPRGIGATTLGKILEERESDLPEKMRMKISDFRALVASIRDAMKEKTVAELISFILEKTRFEEHLSEDDEQDRAENLGELVAIATKYDAFGKEGVGQFLSDAALMSEADTLKDEKNAVRLMTVHASKGLEFKAVFVTGLEQDLFPHKRFDERSIGEERSEEERRLFYVAITRAEERLVLTYAQSRMVYGSRGVSMPSEFLSDIPPHLVQKSEGLYFEGETHAGGHATDNEEVIEWDLFDKFKKK
ncbi:MAG: UvrD-helicase domain-containing protein [Patescibacteria group bacterium]